MERATANADQRRASAAGYLLALMVVAAIVHALWPRVPLWPSGLAAWFAALLLLHRVSRLQRFLCALLIGCGLAGIGYALSRAVLVDLGAPLTKNQALLTMLAAVSFLRLATIANVAPSASAPKGRASFANTLLGVGVFGAVLNLSAPLLIADRIKDAGRLDAFAARSITRIFSGCSGWSPFFGGMAVVITYVPDASVGVLMLAGLPFAIAGGLWTYTAARVFDAERVRDFTGYPMDFRNLWIPLLLAGYVIGFYITLKVSILICIALAAIMLSLTVLVARHGLYSSVAMFRHHLSHGLPAMGSELLLFLSAGVLATGLSAALDSVDTLSVGAYTASTAVVVLAAMVVAACAGLHPVIQVSVLASLLLESNADPTLLAFTFMLGWSMGTSCSPLSGTHLIFQARYGIPSVRAAVRNWPFVANLFIVAAALLFAVARYG